MPVERMDPNQYGWLEGGVMAEHLERYRFAAARLHGDDVLDIACGTGYGTAILARHAAAVTGVDISAEAVETARRETTGVNAFETGDATAIAFADASFDTVVSFETIEHVPPGTVERTLGEFARVLRPGGRLIISTPDKRSYSLSGPPTNAFHTVEFTDEEFLRLLRVHFEIEQVAGQKISHGGMVSKVTRLANVLGLRLVGKIWRGYLMVLRRDAAVKPIVPGRVAMVLLVVARRRAA